MRGPLAMSLSSCAAAGADFRAFGGRVRAFAATDMERGSVKWQGEAPVRIALGGRLVASSIVVGGERVVGDARSE